MTEHSRGFGKTDDKKMIFVYGTLLKGEYNHNLMTSSRFIKYGETLPGYDLFDLGAYPALAEGGSGAVKGEVYEVAREDLKLIDSLEGHPDWYERKQVALKDGSVVETYIMPRHDINDYPIIDSGDWRKRRV